MPASSYSLVPLTHMRRMIAARMTDATQSIPHFRMHAEFEVDALLELRAQRNQNAEQKLSLNDWLIKLCAAALIEVPDLNLQWVDGEIRQFKHADISVVMALPEGLTTPIIAQADLKRLDDISIEVKALAQRAATGKLRLDEIIGGSFSLSNLGMEGVESFDAIINPPQCAILAVGAVRPKLLVGEGGLSRSATCMRVTLSVDHRALDGSVAARFLAALKRLVEQPVELDSPSTVIPPLSGQLK